MKHTFLKTALLTFAISSLFCISCKEAQQAQQQAAVAQKYEVIKVALSSQTLERNYTASIQGKQDIDIYPQVSGFITKVLVSEGDVVKKGETLFVIDQVPYTAALNTAKANVAAAKASVSSSKLTYNSKKELFAQNVISKFELQMSENNLLTTKAQLAQMNALLINAENNLSYTTVTSPCDGVLATLPFRAGSLVGPSIPKPLTTVSDNSEMFVYFSMTEKQLLQLVRTYKSIDSALVSMPQIELNLSDGSIYDFKGSIESISGVIDSKTGAVSLRSVFPNEGRLLHSGGSGSVNIPYIKENIVVIPQIATFEIQDKVFVYKVINGLAASTVITVAPVNNGKEYIVESGLNVGDIIVAEGVGLMRNGTPIAAKNDVK